MRPEPLDHPEQPYKVVVWATGRVGRLAIRAVADHGSAKRCAIRSEE